MDNYKRSYEREWQEAFEGAEITPSDNLWNKIDASLANDEKGWFKKRLIIFQLLTAASITFAIGMGVIAFWNNQNNIQENKTITGKKDSNPDSERNITTPEPDHKTNNEGNITEKSKKPDQSSVIEEKGDEFIQKKSLLTTSGPKLTTNDPEKSIVEEIAEQKKYNILFADKIEWDFNNPLPESDPEIYGIPEWEGFVHKKSDNRESLWAGIKMSAGGFDPNIGTGGDQVVALASQDQSTGTIINNTSQSPGFSYSLGFNIGKRFGNKWILQSGIQYSLQNSNGSSTVFTENNSLERTPIYHFNSGSAESGETIAATSDPIDLNNTFEFLSIPVQAGYLLIDRKFSLVLSGGFSSDIFLRNTLADEEDQFNDVVVKPGDTSPFRTIFFNGLIGTEIIYNLGRNYKISLEPNYKLSINSLTKPGTDLQSNPRSFNIGLRLKYIID